MSLTGIESPEYIQNKSNCPCPGEAKTQNSVNRPETNFITMNVVLVIRLPSQMFYCRFPQEDSQRP